MAEVTREVYNVMKELQVPIKSLADKLFKKNREGVVDCITRHDGIVLSDNSSIKEGPKAPFSQIPMFWTVGIFIQIDAEKLAIPYFVSCIGLLRTAYSETTPYSIIDRGFATTFVKSYVTTVGYEEQKKQEEQRQQWEWQQQQLQQQQQKPVQAGMLGPGFAILMVVGTVLGIGYMIWEKRRK